MGKFDKFIKEPDHHDEPNFSKITKGNIHGAGHRPADGGGRADDVGDKVSGDYLDETIASLEDIEGWTGWPTTDSEARDLLADFIDEMTDVGSAHGSTVVALAMIRLLRERSRS